MAKDKVVKKPIQNPMEIKKREKTGIRTNEIQPKLKTPRLKKLYTDTVRSNMMKKFQYSNVHGPRKILKIVLSMGINKSLDINKCQNDLTAIAGQHSVKTLAKKSISQFSVRKGFESGVKVTLRNDRMYLFLDRLLNIALINWRAFPGLNIRSVNQIGEQLCLSFGIVDKKIFPEIQESSLKKEGFNVTICTNCKNTEEFKFLMEEFGFPFRR